MDINCATCREPWEHYHVLHDAIWECDPTEDEVSEWENGKKLTDKFRKIFARDGWEFGYSVAAIIRCPCCPDDVEVDEKTKQRIENRKMLSDMLGDDLDGAMSEMNYLSEGEIYDD